MSSGAVLITGKSREGDQDPLGDRLLPFELRGPRESSSLSLVGRLLDFKDVVENKLEVSSMSEIQSEYYVARQNNDSPVTF